jgi:hypothetical protein
LWFTALSVKSREVKINGVFHCPSFGMVLHYSRS